MELMYPIVIIICLILALAICFLFNKKRQYTQGKKVANTKYVKETEYYKTKLKQYKILSCLIKGISVVCIVMTGILIARPVKIQVKNEDKYNRDIFLGLDTSATECEVNIEFIKQFKKIIPSIAGDRIGIVIFNTAPVVYCPLTEDYDFLIECLDKIERQMDIVWKNSYSLPYYSTGSEEDIESREFWFGGVLAGSDEKGSSLIGDGLARNIVFFSKVKAR